MAGDEDSGAPGIELEQERSDVANALRVQTVGGLVENQQPGCAQQGRAEPEPLSHPERVVLHGTLVDAAESDPVQGVLHSSGSTGPSAPVSHRVEQREVRTPGQVRVRRRAFHHRPDVWQHVAGRARHRATEHLDLAAGGQD